MAVVKQNSNTKNMIFDVFELVSFVSEIMTLLPGDVIITGPRQAWGLSKSAMWWRLK